MGKFNYAIQLGDNTVIYKMGYGIILCEPSAIYIKRQGNKFTVLAAGNNAMSYEGKETEGCEIVKPIIDGVVVNKIYAIAMLKEFVKRVKETFDVLNCVFLYTVGLRKREINELVNVLYSVNFRDVLLVPSAIAGLLQLDIDATSAYSSMLVNLSNITEISIVGNGELIDGCSVDIGTNMIDKAIKEYIENKYNGRITDKVAGQIRQELATLLANDVLNCSISVTDIDGYGVNEITIESQEIRSIITEHCAKICGAILGLINVCAPNVVDEIKRRGILLCGELCQITGIERFFKSKLNIPVYASEEKDTIILGGGILLNNPQLISEFVKK